MLKKQMNSLALTVITVATTITLQTPATAAYTNTEPNITPKTPLACIALETNSLRLDCYDSLFMPQAATEATQPPSSATTLKVVPSTNLSFKQTSQPKKNLEINTRTDKKNKTELTSETKPIDKPISLLDRRWELSNESKLGVFNLRANQPVYMLQLFYSSATNLKHADSSHIESKFQISAKTKVVENIFKDNGDIWLGYTQASHWQVYTPSHSRPFRETNYEPEASLIFRTNYNILGWNGKLLGFTFNHQSNGGSTELSRSWNRSMVQIGLEKDNWIIMLRPWLRWQEKAATDDNPDIENYIGRGDIHIVRKGSVNEVSLMLRNSFKGGDASHGALELDWTYTLNKSLRGYVQIFHGYGESLADYDHRTTAIGLGVSLVNWY